MITFLNPGNNTFRRMLADEYIDKTSMLRLFNGRIDTTKNLVCISRPRRFGKSYAAQMMCAYYDRTCDSHELFDGLDISRDDSYETHINKYNVIYVDMTLLKDFTDKYNNITRYLSDKLKDDVSKSCPDLPVIPELPIYLMSFAVNSGSRIVMIIDEWDAPIRENPAIERDYLEFLRSLFKSGNTTSRTFAAVYMTGILPIKKGKSQSAISDFNEFTMIKPRMFGEYVGFTEQEVKSLCVKHDVDFEKMKSWYDGYSFRGVPSIYNPNSVMKAIEYDDFDSYWVESSAAEGLMEYISKDYNGMTKTIAELIGGVEVNVDTVGFANDLVTFRGRDDVLTLLIHLGYLAYDSEKQTVRIPNEEIKREFQRSIREVKHEATLKRVAECDKLFYDTVHMNEEAVAEQIEKIHAEETAPLHYNKEDSLRSVIKLAYYTYRGNYLQWEELPSGAGYADIVYLPKKDSVWPALVIELKWSDSPDSAIAQILDRRYPDALKGYGGEIYLVGISYDKDAPAGKRRHSCKILKV